MGMYPDEQVVEIFGKEVSWPGLVEGKFSNGDFSDPAVPPSYIPAETINLIIDNLSSLITKLGGAPNNSAITQLADLFVSAQTAGKGAIRDESGFLFAASPAQGDKSNKVATTEHVKKFVEHPIGWPVSCYSASVPGNYLDASDGGEYLWADYPELNTTIFRGFLTAFATDFGASEDTNSDGLSFNMPDLRGMHEHIAGVSGVKQMSNGNYFDGADLGEYEEDMGQFFQIGTVFGANTYYGRGYSEHRVLNTTASPGFAEIQYLSTGQGHAYKMKAVNDGIHGDYRGGSKFTPAGYAKKLIVRYE